MGRNAAAMATGLALVAAGVVTGASIAGGGSERATTEPVLAAPLFAERPAARASGKRRRAVIQFFYAKRATVPAEGGSIVQPVKCPKGTGQPVSGGARTAQGIDLVYLSRAHPDGSVPVRTFFVGIEDVSDSNPPGSGALVEVACARGIKVRSSG